MIFKLRRGVSKERIGMRIIERENIIGMLNKIVEQQNLHHFPINLD